MVTIVNIYMNKFLPKTSRNPKGFTLVELLVVIAIIAILSVIGMTVYQNVQKNARDAKRRGDINAISKAMEVNYGKTTGGQYDALVGTMFSSGSIPQDPIDTSAVTTDSACPTVCEYCFTQGTSAQTAAACANATGKITTAGPTGGSANPYWQVCANLETTTASTYYCKANSQ